MKPALTMTRFTMWLSMGRRRISSLALCAALCASAAASEAETFHNALSLQGYTGILNTPNAAVADEGTIDALYNNQEDRGLRADTHKEENYLFNVGFFSFAELGGRLMNLPAADRRDLSANVKVRVPFIPKGWPQVAVGMQDVSGGGSSQEAALLRSRYAVVSQDLPRLRLSLGYGLGPERLKGAFGGAEVKVSDWLYLLGEYDTRDANVGVRVVTPEFFGIPVRLHATAKSAVTDGPEKIDVALGLTFPLGLPHHNRAPAPAKETTTPAAAEDGGATAPQVAPSAGDSGAATAETGATSPDGQADPRLAKLKEKLVQGGFLNVRVGVKDRELVVEYENARYNHNELDALGVVSGVVVDSVPPQYRWLTLVMKKEGIKVVSFTAPLASWTDFMRDAAALPDFERVLNISYDVKDDPEVRFVDGVGAPSALRSSLVLGPGVSTLIGSDYGVFDYILSLKADYYLNLWKGAQLNSRWDIPVAWSKNYDDGQPLAGSRPATRWERLMLFQTVKVAPTVIANLGAGMFVHDTYGTVNEVMWTPGTGEHRFRLKQAYLKNDQAQGSAAKKETYLASYRYYFNPLDLYLEGTVGQFYNNDRGFTAELKRFFGDTAFSVYYKNSKPENHGERIQVGGVQFAFPLTPRRDMKPYPLQVRGTDEFSYAMETRIATNGGVNYLYSPVGINPQPLNRLEVQMYNRDRLEEGYLRGHLLRVRDAYLKYR